MSKYKSKDMAMFVEDPKKNPFYTGMTSGTAIKPASFGRIFVKSIFLFMFTLVIGFNDTIQEFSLGLWMNIYDNGIFMFFVALAIYCLIISALISVTMRMLLSRSKLPQLLGALGFASILGFIISTIIACGELVTLWGYNIAELAVFITLAIIFVCLIASYFVVFDVKKAAKMYVVFAITSIIVCLIWLVGIFIPPVYDFLIQLFYVSPLGIVISVFVIGFISYLIMGLLGFLRVNIHKFDRKTEWYCSSIILYLFVRLYIVVARLLLKLAIRAQD